MDTIVAWGFEYDGGAVLVQFPQGDESPWNKREIAIPLEDRAPLVQELLKLSAGRSADTPTLDRLTARRF